MSDKNFSSFGDLETLIAEIASKISGKVDKVSGKGLSTNDYTTADKNKVDALKSASTKDVPTSGNASSSQVVMGNDTRLSDSRNAKDVYSWAKAATKPSYTANEVGAIPTTQKGTASGVAELDANGKVPSSQLPSYVDDTVEGYLYNSKWYSDEQHTHEVTGESGKIYVELSTNKTYRWSGSGFVEISESLALGETSATAYRGDRGKTAYNHSQLTSGNPHNVSKSDVGLSNVPNVSTNDQTPTFSVASTRANIASGEKLSVIMGKIMKFFADLKTVAFSGAYSDLTGTPTITKDAFIGTCTTASNQKDKVVTLNDATGWSLRAGVIVGVKYSYTNTYSATSSNKITLNVNGSGAKVIYFAASNAPTGTNWVGFGGANRYHYYQYDGTYWVFLSHSADNDTGNYNLRFPDAWKAEKAITAAKCCVGTTAGYKMIASGETFDIDYPILYSGSAINAGATTTNFFIYGNNCILTSVKANFTGTVLNMLYLVGSAFDGKNFTIDSEICTCTPNVSGKYYLPIGTCYSTTRFQLYPIGHVFYYDGTNLLDYASYSGNSAKVNGHSVNADVPSTAKFTARTYFGTCTGQAANQKKAVVVSADQNFTLEVGALLFVKFDANNTFNATTSASISLNVNSTGDKVVYIAGTAAGTGTNTTFFGRTNYINQYIYDGTYWVWTGSSSDNNTTYTPQALGFGYGTCTTAAATAAKVATLSGYALVTNGFVSIKFSNDVPASATLNINSKGAKAIYNRGVAIAAGVIKAGDIATFVYSGQYHLISIDRPIDATPTANSNNLVTSGGVKNSENDIYTTMGKMGAKNLIPYPYYDATGNVQPTTGSDSGITWIINDDNSITFTGEATADFYFYMAVRSNAETRIPLKAGKYCLTGCPANGSDSTYNMYLNGYDAGTSTAITGMRDIGSGIEREYTNDIVVGIYIEIKSGYSIQSSLTFEPMLRLACDMDSTYQPYAKTNKQLTDAIKEMESNFQDGVDAVYDAVVAKGSTPASHSLSDIIAAIAAIQTSPPTQTKSCTPSTSTQTISPDDGYLLSSVSVGAISTQEKTITSSRSAQTVTPDSGKYLSKVTVKKYPDASGTYTASSRGSALDMGATNNLRYVNTNNVPNSNSGTYTYGSGSTGGTVDLGANNSYRYVNASNVYAKGKADGDVTHTMKFEAYDGKNGCKVYKDGVLLHQWNLSGSYTCTV